MARWQAHSVWQGARPRQHASTKKNRECDHNRGQQQTATACGHHAVRRAVNVYIYTVLTCPSTHSLATAVVVVAVAAAVHALPPAGSCCGCFERCTPDSRGAESLFDLENIMRLLAAIALLCTISTCFGFGVALPSAAVRAREALTNRAREALTNRAAIMHAALPAALAGDALFAKGFGLSLLFSSSGYKKTSNFVTYGKSSHASTLIQW
jgi:hypothetical protein